MLLILRLRGHVHARLGRDRILRLPEARHSLLLSVEIHTGLAVEGVRTAAGNGLLVAGEGEHGQWDGNRHVDADLTGFDLLLEASSGCAGASEDCCAVPVLVVVDELDSFVQGRYVETYKHRTEDFLAVAGHFRLDVGDDGGSDPVPLGYFCGFWPLPSRAIVAP